VLAHAATVCVLTVGCLPPCHDAARPLARCPTRRYVLWAAEEQGYELPYACRLGCCTACTVKVKEGEMYQPHSLGLSKSLRDQVRLACVLASACSCDLTSKQWCVIVLHRWAQAGRMRFASWSASCKLQH